MATINPTMNIRNGTGPGEDDLSILTAQWSNLNGANSVGAAVSFPQHSDRAVQLTGTFNTGTVVVEGSNDGSNYSNLTDSTGNVASFTAAGIKQIVQVPLYTRMNVVANGVATDVTATMLLRRNSPLTR